MIARPALTARLRRLAAAAALALAPFVAAPAMADNVAFEGNGFLSLSGDCGPYGFLVGDLLDVAFVPAGVGQNGPDTHLSFFASRLHMQGFTLRGGRFTDRWRPVEGGGAGYGVPWTYDLAPRIRVLQQVPAQIRPRTDGVRLRGEVRNFGGIRGCVASFDTNMVRRPW